ncbi:quinone oxidoreductase family protein [Actinokineospora diospyrosa]|uniref:NADPH2:quinone reductase n=1 Tax=Actinokineospora diospyrosa TaxID=103728 RepID=A0ABT1I704_9PSEU|nr:quinone oxidoreductase [Actinokineospora diospyrosa]MCP2268410.1 NADPH2:quinone reductase [Actinokineospora diospyrosa]
MPQAIVVSVNGGPEVLVPTEVPSREPGAGEVLVRVAAAGVNFIDTYQRGGVYKVPLPFTPGLEGAGTVEAVGPEVTTLAVGDRVAWAQSIGSYADQVIVPAAWAVPVPAAVTDETAAATLLQGLTAHYLVTSTHPVREGDTVLVHAAAGGVGLLLVQLAKSRGARVIGTVSTPDKERLAREAGADEVIRYTEEDFVTRTKALTDGTGVAAVYDGVGATTFDGSLAVLKPRGVLALFGGSSGPVPPVDPQRLNAAGSVFLTRPTLAHHLATPEENRWRVDEVFGAVASGDLRVSITGRYALSDARQAHEDLESRKTTGKLLLLP